MSLLPPRPPRLAGLRLCLDAGAEVAPRLARSRADLRCVLSGAALLGRIYLGTLLGAGLRAGDLRDALPERVALVLVRAVLRHERISPGCALRLARLRGVSRVGVRLCVLSRHTRSVACVELAGAGADQVSVALAVVGRVLSRRSC